MLSYGNYYGDSDTHRVRRECDFPPAEFGKRADYCGWNRNRLSAFRVERGVTLLVAVLLAYFLDPVVTWLEDLHIPRRWAHF